MPDSARGDAPIDTLERLRRLLLATLLLGMTGTAIELLLLQHDEDPIQLVPLVLLGLGVATVLWHARSRSPATETAVRGVMALFLAAGAAGIYFHYAANVEFQREGDATLAGARLLWKVLQAKAPPALAPGIMVQLGLIGLAYTYRSRER